MSPADPTPHLPGLVRAGLAQGRARAAAADKPAAEIAAVDPVAQVLVDVPLAHLDRPFDYAVPAAMAEAARPGVRVKVRFAGQEVGGYLVARTTESAHTGRLTPLRRVVSPVSVLSPAVAEVVGVLAERYAGSRSDLLRLAVPPRHAKVEAEVPGSASSSQGAPVDPDHLSAIWAGHPRASTFLQHLADPAGAPSALWHALPGADWPLMIAAAAAQTRQGGRGVLICVPDGKDLSRVDAALTGVLGPDQHVSLTASAGPSRRYRDFLSVRRGARRIVVGTRAAAFAPVQDLGLIVVWDDGDDLFAEPRAPYPHTREVLLERAQLEGSALLIGGFSRSVEAHRLGEDGRAHDLGISRPTASERAIVTVAGATEHDLDRDPSARASRVPKQVHDAIRRGLETGPVLLQTPRSGYAPSLACARCRTPARCTVCTGPMGIPAATSPPGCRWCGTAAPGWTCPECGDHGLRAPVVGRSRTAEELGRTFPGARVVESGGDVVKATLPDRPALVVATPGAEPVAAGGYSAVVLLDTWLSLGWPGLQGDGEALRRWSNAAALVRPGGAVVVVGDPTEPAIQALVRWDQPGFAARESATRQSAHLPPASRMATITGTPGAVDDALTLLVPPPGTEILGPVPVAEGADADSRVVVRVPRQLGPDLSRALGELQRLRSARKLDPVRIQVDPTVL